MVGTLALVAGLIVTGGFLLGQRRPTHTSEPAPTVQARPASPAPRSTTGPGGSPYPVGLSAEFAQLQTRLHTKLGIVLRPVGAGQNEPLSFGDWTSGPAWSTIKVPLVIAAMREPGSDQVTQEMTAVITESDNAAAEQIWAGLGDPVTAAGKVESVLGATGDPTTVQSQKVRPEYTAFGQTEWPLTNQAQFLAAAACDPRNEPVLGLMGQVENDQKWGLGVLPDTKIKGGWGPSRSNNYLVRQIAILPTPNGLTVVAMAAEPESGSFADGTQDLTETADWLQTHLAALPAGKCS